ncbi:MAG: hypothetical protein LVT47_09995 [Cyanobacteria bacterium LVE1205-1]
MNLKVRSVGCLNCGTEHHQDKNPAKKYRIKSP